MSEPWLKRNNPPYWNSMTSCWKTASSFLQTLSVRHHCFWRICFVCRSHFNATDVFFTMAHKGHARNKNDALQTKRQKPQRDAAECWCPLQYMVHGVTSPPKFDIFFSSSSSYFIFMFAILHYRVTMRLCSCKMRNLNSYFKNNHISSCMSAIPH